MNEIDESYWWRVVALTLVGSAVLSKLYFVVLVFTWGVLPEPIYDILLYAGNWPSLVTDTFPWFYDRNGTRGISIPIGIPDLKSVIVNCIGQLPIGLLVGMACRRRRNDLPA